ncbi:hypothetical protein H8F24_04335 [Synechococcus sp. CBW1002]|uniref:hypothetical protein n=1 Tax=Synechococcus sp. CBW1002 TaxID=1353134 RepID=UPI0018CCDD27|nr:hypothetical protein [Synechococcus sp. CBW1002]QPN60634.1 hypothetical protein H8F24_04335 [Synechococcus sp. CBW1002]
MQLSCQPVPVPLALVVLQQSEAYVTAEGETLSSVAAKPNLSLSLLWQFKPELASWPSEEPLPAGTTLLLPVYRSTTPIPAGLQLLVPGFKLSSPLPAGEWITLPARRSHHSGTHAGIRHVPTASHGVTVVVTN